MSIEEILEIVNEKGEFAGSAPRSKIHGNNKLLHKVVHVFVINKSGSILLQKRSTNKDVAPGKWDTSVGGHVNQNEDIKEAVMREMEEELGIVQCELEFLYTYIHSNPYESELVYTHLCLYEGEISFNRDEIDEVRYWTVNEIKANLGKGILSDNFEDEFQNYMKHKRLS